MYCRYEELLKEKGLSNYKMAKETGISQATLSDWKNGKSTPKSDKLQIIADYFDVSVDYLMGRTDDKTDYDKIDYPSNFESAQQYVSYLKARDNDVAKENKKATQDEGIPVQSLLPIVGSIPAGYPATAVENIVGYYPSLVPDTENHFYLRVKGDSMINAGIKDGCLVLIEKQNTADNGQVVACRVNGDEATLKRFKQVKDTVILMPENPDYEPIVLSTKEFDEGYAEIIGIAKSIVCEI